MYHTFWNLCPERNNCIIYVSLSFGTIRYNRTRSTSNLIARSTSIRCIIAPKAILLNEKIQSPRRIPSPLSHREEPLPRRKARRKKESERSERLSLFNTEPRQAIVIAPLSLQKATSYQTRRAVYLPFGARSVSSCGATSIGEEGEERLGSTTRFLWSCVALEDRPDVARPGLQAAARLVGEGEKPWNESRASLWEIRGRAYIPGSAMPGNATRFVFRPAIFGSDNGASELSTPNGWVMGGKRESPEMTHCGSSGNWIIRR